MKKKILVVFLICFLLLGVASPVFAAQSENEFPVIDSSLPYQKGFFFPPDGNTDPLEYSRMCLIINSDVPIPDKPLYVTLNSNGFVGAFHIPVSPDASEIGIHTRRFKPARQMWFSGFDTTVDVEDITLTDGYLQYNLLTSELFISSVSSSDFDILVYGTNENFPPAPPLAELTEELIQMTPGALDLDGKMMILVPFGISLLALLISLPLLSNLLRRFLN